MKHISTIILFAVAALPACAEEVSANGIGITEIDACSDAKTNAERKCPTSVDYYDDCTCGEKQTPPNNTWQCAVDATCKDAETENTKADDSELDSDTHDGFSDEPA